MSRVLGTLRKVLHTASWTPHRRCTMDAASRVRQPFSSNTSCVCVSKMMISRAIAIGLCTNINPCVTVPSQTPHTTQKHSSDRMLLRTSRHHRRCSFKRLCTALDRDPFNFAQGTVSATNVRFFGVTLGASSILPLLRICTCLPKNMGEACAHSFCVASAIVDVKPSPVDS